MLKPRELRPWVWVVLVAALLVGCWAIGTATPASTTHHTRTVNTSSTTQAPYVAPVVSATTIPAPVHCTAAAEDTPGSSCFLPPSVVATGPQAPTSTPVTAPGPNSRPQGPGNPDGAAPPCAYSEDCG